MSSQVTKQHSSPSLHWSAHEHADGHKDKSTDWFWVLGIIAISGAILAIFFGNLLFGVLILLLAFTMVLYVQSDSEEISVTINRKGVRVDSTLYPYSSLVSYWVEDHEDDVFELEDEELFRQPQLLLKPARSFMPIIILPIDTEIDLEELREYLIEYLDEEELEEPTSHRIVEILGF